MELGSSYFQTNTRLAFVASHMSTVHGLVSPECFPELGWSSDPSDNMFQVLFWLQPLFAIRYQWVTRINKILLLIMSFPLCKPLKTRGIINKDVRTILISHQMSPALAFLLMESYLLVGIILRVHTCMSAIITHSNCMVTNMFSIPHQSLLPGGD